MTEVWVLVAVGALAIVLLLGYVGWRDRRRTSSADDNAAARIAGAAAHRNDAGAQGPQAYQKIQDFNGHG